MRIRPTSERPTGLTRYVVSATVTDGPIGFADSQTATENFTATSIFAKSLFLEQSSFYSLTRHLFAC